MKFTTKKPICIVIAILMVVILSVFAGCSPFSSNYKQISEEEFYELHQLMLEWPDDNYEMTYSLKSADPELTNGIKSLEITYLYKWIDSEDPNAYYADEINEHIVVNLTTTDAEYKAEYWYVTTVEIDMDRPMYVQLTSGKDSLKFVIIRDDIYSEQPSFLDEKWYDVWGMCARGIIHIARTQFYNLHWDIRRSINFENLNNISKSGNKYKITKSETDTLEYYFFKISDENVTAFRQEQTGVDGTIICQINQSSKNVELPSWYQSVKPIY